MPLLTRRVKPAAAAVLSPRLLPPQRLRALFNFRGSLLDQSPQRNPVAPTDVSVDQLGAHFNSAASSINCGNILPAQQPTTILLVFTLYSWSFQMLCGRWHSSPVFQDYCIYYNAPYGIQLSVQNSYSSSTCVLGNVSLGVPHVALLSFDGAKTDAWLDGVKAPPFPFPWGSGHCQSFLISGFFDIFGYLDAPLNGIIHLFAALDGVPSPDLIAAARSVSHLYARRSDRNPLPMFAAPPADNNNGGGGNNGNGGGAVTPVSSPNYASRADLENLFGPDNVARWSQLDNASDSADLTRIAAALAYADAQIDNALRDGPYLLPLSLNSARPTVTHWAAVIAGVWLHNNRGQYQSAPNPYARMLADVHAQLAAAKAGLLRLDAPRIHPLPTAPTLAWR